MEYEERTGSDGESRIDQSTREYFIFRIEAYKNQVLAFSESHFRHCTNRKRLLFTWDDYTRSLEELHEGAKRCIEESSNLHEAHTQSLQACEAFDRHLSQVLSLM